jgi:methylase of polypeptide subunit release factors
LKRLPIEECGQAEFESESVFRPTATSRILAGAADAYLKEGQKVLDLGCGSGIVGFHLAFRREPRISLYMSDVSSKSTELASKNGEAIGTKVTIKTGSVFEPWIGYKFDLIVSDISGVIPAIGDRMGWFDGVPNDSGSEGTELAARVIRESPNHLNENGALIFPIISLSNEQTLLNEMSKKFNRVEKLVSVALPLGASNDEAVSMADQFPAIRIEFMGGLPVFHTTIYRCSHAKG